MTLPSPARFCHLAVHQVHLQKAAPLQSSCFWMIGNMVRLVNSMTPSPLPHFICQEVCSLIGSSALWSTMMVDKIFRKTMDGNWGQACGQRRKIHIQSLLKSPDESESKVLVARSCLTLCDPMDCSPPGSSIQEIFQARILEWVAISSSRGFSQPRDRTCVPCVGRWILCRLSHYQLDFSKPSLLRGSPSGVVQGCKQVGR